ncbi:MAG TPA: LamG domain-containing protein [Thermoleophilaceae bacterium]
MKKALAVTVALLALGSARAHADFSPVAYWPFNEGSGTTAADASGLGNDGTLIGGLQWVPGRFGTALSFDAGGSFVQVPDQPSLEPPVEVSVSAWVRRAGSPGIYKYVLSKGASSGCISASYALYSGAAGGLQFYVSTNRGQTYTLSPDAGAGIWDGNWHLAVGTYDGTSVRLFVDGVQVGNGRPRAGTIDYDLPKSNDLFIGHYAGCPGLDFTGDIDEPEVFAQALTRTTIQTSFKQQLQETDVALLPVLRRMKISPSAFATSGARKRGATITYTDSVRATTKFTVLRRVAGVRTHGRCTLRRPRRAGRRCAANVALGSFKHRDRVGRNTVRFRGRIRGRPLPPGRYRLVAIPRHGSNTGARQTVTFRVLR